MPDPATLVSILYTNWKGITRWRRIRPLEIWFGTTEWHPESQWFLRAQDVAKNVLRDFALQDIQKWDQSVKEIP